MASLSMKSKRRMRRQNTGLKPGRYKAGYSVRCKNHKCRLYNTKRWWRRHAPDSYWGRNRRYGVCPCCDRYLVVDWHRTSGAENRGAICSCANYPFPHRRGSLFCVTGRAGKLGWVYNGPSSAAEFERNPEQMRSAVALGPVADLTLEDWEDLRHAAG